MSDDLVKRLYDRRVCSPAQNSCRNDLALEQAADRIEELEAELAAIEKLMVSLIKFAERAKKTAGSENSKRREHYRMHALSEALGAIRKELKGETE